jgi:hypothetical protein
MRRAITGDEFGEALLSFRRRAFRLELQDAYDEPAEREWFTRWLAGTADLPSQIPAFAGYYEWVAATAAEGRRIERVRIHSDPPTDYQRWEQWVSRWNVAAGESIHYLTRRQATAAGLLPGVGQDDWWLLDKSTLIIMRFDDQHRRVSNELVTDADDIDRALRWWDLAVRIATGHNSVAA